MIAISIKEIPNYCSILEQKLKEEKVKFSELVPHVSKVFDSRSELSYSFTSLWESYALMIFQLEKYGFIHQHLQGDVKLYSLTTLDGSVMNDVGYQTIIVTGALLFDPQIFTTRAKQMLTTPDVKVFANSAETKKGVAFCSRITGKLIPQLESFKLKLRNNLTFDFLDIGQAVDGSAGQKMMCLKDPSHKCYFKNCCLSDENKEKLLSQVYLNSIKPKNYETIMSNLDEETIKSQITNRSNGTKSLTESQADDVQRYFEELCDLENPDPILSGKVFTCFGRFDSEYPGYTNAISIFKDVIIKLGGKFEEKKKENAQFVLCSYNYSRKILGLNAKKKIDKHPLENKTLVSLKFIVALAFKKCTLEDVQFYQFTRLTRPENHSLCICSKDPNHNGMVEIPHLLKSYWEELKRLNPLEKAKKMFKEFCKRSGLNYDVLHFNKGNWMVVMATFEKVGYIDIELFKKQSGGKSKKSPNQMSGKKARNILCGHQTTILPFLSKKLSRKTRIN